MKPKRSLLNKNSTYLTMIIPIVILFLYLILYLL